MPKKQKPKFIKPIDNNGSVDVPLQFNIKKSIEQSKKIKPQNVFEGYSKGNKK
jgi:hypothetical protein